MLLFLQLCFTQEALRGPPKVEGAPLLLNSYIPASMQIIAHVTELLKYDLRPGGSSIVTTTTTVRPTPSHKPGLYAPVRPLGPEVYFSKSNAFNEYLERIKNTNGGSYFDRYAQPLVDEEQAEGRSSSGGFLPSQEELRALSKYS